MRCWRGYLSGVTCRFFVYGPADATASQNPSSLASFRSRLVLPFWYRLTQVVLEKRPLKGCSSISSSGCCISSYCSCSVAAYVCDDWEVSRDNVTILEKLSQGSFGMVYEGMLHGDAPDEPDVHVAVKVGYRNTQTHTHPFSGPFPDYPVEPAPER